MTTSGLAPELRGCRVVVTGAGGFIGLPVVASLVRSGAEVHALSTRPAPSRTLGARWHQVDLTDAAAVEALMRTLAPEQLIHLAWYTSHGSFWTAPENLLWVSSSLRLMGAFVHNGGRRVVMLGSCAEYDWRAAQGPLEEVDAPIAPSTLYGVSKDALRRVAAAYAAQAEVELAWARPFFLFGPRESRGRLVPSVIGSLLAGEVAQIASGEQVRDFTYVDDVADALVALLGSTVIGEVNIASGVGIKIVDMVDSIARVVGGPSSVHRGALPDPPEDPPRLVAGVSRLHEEVGFQPRWTLAAGLEATVRWWRAPAQAARRA